MKKLITVFLIIFFGSTVDARTTKEYDLVVYGGTSSGVIAAYAAAKEGLSVALLEQGKHVGGLTSSGLGSVDVGKVHAIGGYALDFFKRAGLHYNSTKPVFKITPSVAEKTFLEMLSEAGVDIYYDALLVEKTGVIKSGNTIKSLELTNGNKFNGKVFIDATYEGDLMAWAEVPYIVGRESTKQYNESQAGVRPFRSYKASKSSLAEIKSITDEFPLDNLYGEIGEIGEGDSKTQAYTFRLTLTTNEDNKVPFRKPDHYNPDRYSGLLRRIINNKLTKFGQVLTIYQLPDDKTDINHLDLINASHSYPDGSYEERKRIWQYHKDYQEGYLYFIANDPRVPEVFRKDAQRWGYAKDEFIDNNNWPYHLYIREGRRMIGSYVMRQQDSWENATKEDRIGLGSYFLDSHSVQRIVNGEGRLIIEGGLRHIPYKPYEIPYRAIIPKKSDCENLFVTVCVSASHVLYTSLRMEPVYMIMGHAAGIAASIALNEQLPVQNIPVTTLQDKLKDQNQVLRFPFTEWSYQETSDFDGIVVDNLDADMQGKWKNTAREPFLMAGAKYIEQQAEETASVTFNPALEESGLYELYIMYAHAERNSKEVLVIVESQEGAKEVYIDMQKKPSDPSGWESLGIFQLGKNAHVKISNKGQGGVVVADGVRLVKK